MNILLSNDDGIYAVGLRALYTAFTNAGHNVYVVAPMTEQSAVSSSITVFQGLRAKEISDVNFIGMGVHGTPADCVKLGLLELCPKRPDLVLSGINAGPNAGPDVKYSGTIAAACEGAFAGYPAVAISYNNYNATDMHEQARHAVTLVESLPFEDIPKRTVINVNYPAVPVAQCLGVRTAFQSQAQWNDCYDQRQDPRGRDYWWLHGEMQTEHVEEGSDRDLIEKGYITVTPLRFEYTHTECLKTLSKIYR